MSWQVRLSSGDVVRYAGAGYLQHGGDVCRIYTEKDGDLIAVITSGSGAIVERESPEPEVFSVEEGSE
jgi:hypothetical protein